MPPPSFSIWHLYFKQKYVSVAFKAYHTCQPLGDKMGAKLGGRSANWGLGGKAQKIKKNSKISNKCGQTNFVAVKQSLAGRARPMRASWQVCAYAYTQQTKILLLLTLTQQNENPLLLTQKMTAYAYTSLLCMPNLSAFRCCTVQYTANFILQHFVHLFMKQKNQSTFPTKETNETFNMRNR